MNYRHSYHAGNFADIFKHVIQLQLLQKLRMRETPFCVLDTHAGIGYYDLMLEEAQKTGEYSRGIGAIYTTPLTPFFTPYLTLVRHLNPDGNLRYYPGSPAIASSMLREDDRLILAELHPEDAAELKENFRKDKRIAVHHTNGYHAMKAFLPPKEKRGLVLIDPPFEKTDEFEQLISALTIALHRFRHGIYAIWYPIKSLAPVEQFYRQLLAIGAPNLLRCEMTITSGLQPDHLNGCGMAIINAPWKLDEELEPALSELLVHLQQDAGAVRIEAVK